MKLPILIGSLVAILLVSLIVRALRLGETRLELDEDALRIAEEQLAGFRAVEPLVSRAGDAALVMGDDGSIALLKKHGAQFAARRLTTPLIIEKQDGIWVIDSGEKLFGKVRLSLDQPGEDKLLTMM